MTLILAIVVKAFGEVCRICAANVAFFSNAAKILTVFFLKMACGFLIYIYVRARRALWLPFGWRPSAEHGGAGDGTGTEGRHTRTRAAIDYLPLLFCFGGSSVRRIKGGGMKGGRRAERGKATKAKKEREGGKSEHGGGDGTTATARKQTRTRASRRMPAKRKPFCHLWHAHIYI